jgi:hypothetical protein
MCEVLVRLHQNTRYQVQEKGSLCNKNISNLRPQNTCVISGFRRGISESFFSSGMLHNVVTDVGNYQSRLDNILEERRFV